MSTPSHIPHGAPPEGYNGPKRSLILPGGGLRLSYQAGAARALLEAGLCFSHMDGTSGGGLNLAMLLSGLSPVQMCDRWRTLKIMDTVSLMPFEDYLKTSELTAMGAADGFINKVLPHLGVDFEKINAAGGVEATFNVCNYNRKVNEVVPHEKLDVDLLIAGISLPGVLPPVRKGDSLYLDSGFVQDANLMEAVRRGADELWLIWCLGNTGEYRGGALRVYVQMLEISANAALNKEFEQIKEINARILNGETVYGHKRPIKLHLIIPEYPLPLDPDLYLGRVDSATLIDMGYADAKKYLKIMSEDGVPFEPEATQMKASKLGVTFREKMSGGFAMGEADPAVGKKKGESAHTTLTMHASINIRDLDGFISDPSHAGSITGRITFGAFGENIPASSGVFNLFSSTDDPKLKLMIYELGFEHDGRDYYLAGKKEVRHDSGFDVWKDTTTLYTRLHEGADSTGPVVGAGILSLGVKELAHLVSSMHATNATSVKEETQALLQFGRFFMGDLWDSYVKK